MCILVTQYIYDAVLIVSKSKRVLLHTHNDYDCFRQLAHGEGVLIYVISIIISSPAL